MKLLKGKAAIEAAITSIQNRGKKLDRDINVAAVSAMAHHAEHGDVTLINTLVAAMPKGSRVNALRDFILCFGKVAYNEETKVFDHDKSGTFDLEGAMQTAWTEFKPEQEYQPFDVMEALKNLCAKLDKADALKGDKVTPEQAAMIKDMAARMGVDV